MVKRRIISSFNDQEETLLNKSVYPIKTSGDQTNETNASNASINFKNERVRYKISLSESAQTNTYVSTALSKDFNSSQDNEFYFGGAKKFIDLQFPFFSGAIVSLSATFELFDRYTTDVTTIPPVITVSPFDGAIYVCGHSFIGSTHRLYVKRYRETLQGLVSEIVDEYAESLPNGQSSDQTYGVAVSPVDGAVYVCGVVRVSSIQSFIRRSPNGNSRNLSNS